LTQARDQICVCVYIQAKKIGVVSLKKIDYRYRVKDDLHVCVMSAQACYLAIGLETLFTAVGILAHDCF